MLAVNFTAQKLLFCVSFFLSVIQGWIKELQHSNVVEFFYILLCMVILSLLGRYHLIFIWCKGIEKGEIGRFFTVTIRIWSCKQQRLQSSFHKHSNILAWFVLLQHDWGLFLRCCCTMSGVGCSNRWVFVLI